jgi:hypothetical protein
VCPSAAPGVPAAVDAVFAACVAGGGSVGGPLALSSGGGPAGSAGGAGAFAGAAGGSTSLLGRDLRLEWVHDCK